MLEQVRARRDLGGGVAEVPSGARHLRPAAGRCADAAREDPAGRPHARAQLESLADVAEQLRARLCARHDAAELQFHFLELADVETVMRRMADEGITTREACGNSVRNITACPFAGVAVDEVFDVTPYAEALTRYLLRHPLASVLPRKFKIAFEGCPRRSRLCVHQRSGLDRAHRASATGAGARLPAHRRRRHVDSAGIRARAVRLSAGGRDVQRGRSDPARLSPPRRSRAQAAQPHEVPDQDAGLGSLARRGAGHAGSRSQRGGRRRLPFDPDSPPVDAAPAWNRAPTPPGRRNSARS